eukprot:362156-Chlamydomonas_euryale.AAC.15
MPRWCKQTAVGRRSHGHAARRVHKRWLVLGRMVWGHPNFMRNSEPVARQPARMNRSASTLITLQCTCSLHAR